MTQIDGDRGEQENQMSSTRLVSRPDDVSPPLLTVEEVARMLGLKRTATYDAIRRGQLPSLRVGRRVFVPAAALKRILESPGPAPSAGH